jgi:hypothetical protein
MNRPPGPRTTSQEIAAQVATVPVAGVPRVTTPDELAAREALVQKKADRSRIAEAVALVTTVSVALAAIAHELASIVHDLTARQCP